MVNFKSKEEEQKKEAERLKVTLSDMRKNGMKTNDACKEISQHTFEHQELDYLVTGDKANPFLAQAKQGGGCCTIS